MEPSQPPVSTQYVGVTSVPSRNKFPVTIAFAVASLLFFLPFVEIKCNGAPIAEARGIDLAMGFQMKPAGSLKSLSDWGNKNDDIGNTEAQKKQDPNLFAIAALGLGVLGVLVTLLAFRSVPKSSGIIAILAIAAMVALMIQVKSQVKKESLIDDSFGAEQFMITVNFTVWYFVSLIAFLLAVFLSFRKPAVIQTAPVHPNVFPVTSSSSPPATDPGPGSGGVTDSGSV